MTEHKNPYNEQIMRFSSLPKFPMHPQGVKELRETLRRHTSTLDRATSVVDKLLDDLDRCPTPKELVAASAEVARQVEAVPHGCEICEGQPWVTVQKLVWEYPQAQGERRGKQYMADGSERCHCSKGQWFREKDRENKKKREAGLPV